MTAPATPINFPPLIGELDVQQLGTLLIRENKLHDGLFELSVRFRVSIGVFGVDDVPQPGGLISVAGIGLLRAAEKTPMTLDAAVVNPAPKAALGPRGGSVPGAKRRGRTKAG